MLGAAFVPAPPPLCHPSGASPFSPLKMTMLGSLQVKARGDASSRHVPCWVPATNPDVAKLRLYRKCIARCGVHISVEACLAKRELLTADYCFTHQRERNNRLPALTCRFL